MNTQKINEKIAELLEGFSGTSIDDDIWDICMSLLFSTDFQEWGAANQYAAFKKLRSMGKIIHLLTNN